jgi:FkbM family methyltransferase
VLAAISRSWRTWVYTLLTFIGPARLGAAAQRPFGAQAIQLLQKLLARGSVSVRGGAAFGLRLSTDHLPIDHRQGYGLIRGVLEPAVQEALRRHVAPGAVVYDIGANIGFFSVLSASLAGPDGRVEAFEPVPANSSAVRANAVLNRFPTISVHEAAVSDHAGVDELCVPGEAGWAHLIDRGRHPQAEQLIPVRLMSLDEEIERGQLPAPDVVKIDVEGSEIAVLTGFTQTLRSRDVTVICELHETNAEVVDLMTLLGYSAVNLEGPADVVDAGPVHALFQRASERPGP